MLTVRVSPIFFPVGLFKSWKKGKEFRVRNQYDKVNSLVS
jgi:hypothetical protein